MSLLFIDAEFSGLHQKAKLLSLALVPATGPWFYAVFTDVDNALLSSWHQEHVIPQLRLTDAQLKLLPPGQYLVANSAEVVAALSIYLAGFDQIVTWADVPAYDWVLFCELFGGALSLPTNIHYVVRDLATLFEAKGYDIDIDRFAFAYDNLDAGPGATINSADGRGGSGQVPATTAEGLLRHNALGDALACKKCWTKLMEG